MMILSRPQRKITLKTGTPSEAEIQIAQCCTAISATAELLLITDYFI